MRIGEFLAWSALVVTLASCRPDPAIPSLASTDLPSLSLGATPANVVVVSIDTLRADRLGCYGASAPASPVVDAFADDAVLFESAIAQAPSTLPSHASLMTSLLPAHHGASWGLSTPLPDAAVTLAEVLRDVGYATAAFTGGGQLAPEYGLAQGFDLYRLPRERDSLAHAADAAVEWLETERPKSFFLFLHTYEVHSPYTPDPALLARIETEYSGGLPSEISTELVDTINAGGIRLESGDLDHIRACYDAEILSADNGFGRLLEHLQAQGVYDRTLIVFTSDHGEEFGEHGVVAWHSHTLYDELLHVPLVVKFPGQWAAGSRVSHQVRLIDVAPTILDVLGIPRPGQFTGTDLRRVAQADEDPNLPAVSQQDSAFGFKFSSVRVGGWKLYPSYLFNKPLHDTPSMIRRGVAKVVRKVRPFRLLDLSADPGEMVDAGGGRGDLKGALRNLLETEITSRPHLSAPPVVVDDETTSKLKALGYVE